MLLVNTSMAMNGAPLEETNDGVQRLRDQLLSDDHSSERVEMAIVTFGGDPKVVHEFALPRNFTPPDLIADGPTYMGAGVMAALDLLDQRIHKYREAGITFYRPFVWMITRGGNSADDWQSAVERIYRWEKAGRGAFFAMGFGDTDFDTLSHLTVRSPVTFTDFLKNFEGFFMLHHGDRPG